MKGQTYMSMAQSLEIEPHKYRQLSFDKGAIISMQKDYLFNNNIAGVIAHLQKILLMNFDLKFITHTKINSNKS